MKNFDVSGERAGLSEGQLTVGTLKWTQVSMAPVVDHQTRALVEDGVAAWMFAPEVQHIFLFLCVPLLHFFERFCRYR